MSSENPSHSSSSGLFERLKSSAKQAAAQAQTVYEQKAHRYLSDNATAGTAYESKGFDVNDLKNIAVKYAPGTSPFTIRLQQTIKGAKGVVAGHHSVEKNTKAFAKNLFVFTQEQEGLDDVKDIGDRLAWLEFQQAELHANYAARLEQSRAALKDIRNFENKLEANRLKRQELKSRLAQLQEKKAEAVKIEAVQHELSTIEAGDAAYESSVRALKRQKLQEAYTLQYGALKELGEKLSILAGYGQVLVQGLSPNTGDAQYTDFDRTASVKSQVESELASYPKGGLIPLPHVASTGLSRNSTIDSFGQTHAKELAAVPEAAFAPEKLPSNNPYRSSDPVSPRPNPFKSSTDSLYATPTGSTGAAPVAIPPLAAEAPSAVPDEPTVAETGKLIQGTNGPAEGQLPDRRPTNSPAQGPTAFSAPQAGPPLPARKPALSKAEERQQEVEENWNRVSANQGLGASGLNRADTQLSRVEGQDLPSYSELGAASGVERQV